MIILTEFARMEIFPRKAFRKAVTRIRSKIDRLSDRSLASLTGNVSNGVKLSGEFVGLTENGSTGARFPLSAFPLPGRMPALCPGNSVTFTGNVD